jgi:hypothetical protein
MTTILLTASRALLDTEESKQWFRAKVQEVITAPVSIITGDAKSDRFAMESLSGKIDGLVYCLDGFARTGYLNCFNTWVHKSMRQWISSEDLRATNSKRLPLNRNAAMVNVCPADTICHAFVAPWSRTHGTEHTLGLAARRGLQGNKCKLCRNGMTTPAQALRYICRWYLETTGQRPSAENSLTTTPKEDE